ncbi:MAG: glycosyltransferase family 2 protein [Clostridia bacterium]|nr:glycosyltransferase family 2 protein [Clostridia bacterium]
MTPKISVIVPVYKVEKYLDRCVSSILEQTFSDFELILVDDGSPDKCGEMCDAYAEKDDRITVIHKENGGLSDARNAGIDIANGEYLSFVDSDDYVAPDFLESMYGAIDRTGCMMSVCGIESFDDNGATDAIYSPASEETVVIGEDMYESLYQPSAWSKMYHRSIFDDIRYPVGRLFEDCFIYHLILDKIDKLVYVGKTLYYYYIRTDSIMHEQYKLKNTDIVDAVYQRAVFLDGKGYHKHADEAYLAVYSRLASAYTQLDRRQPEIKSRLEKLKSLYDSCYERMIKDEHFSAKQKAKLRLFRYAPSLHVKLFPMYTK